MITVDDAAVDAVLARARRDVDDGSLPSCQVALAYRGELLADETFGADPSARYVTFSVTKAFTAALAWLVLGEGALADDTRVADLVPEFADNGKGGVTVEHLLTHTAGFPRAPMRNEQGAVREQRVARMATWRLDWAPGTQTAYHATSAYWALVEMLDRVTGADYRNLFTERIAHPLGLTSLRLGVGAEEAPSVRRVCVVGAVEDDGRTLGSDIAEAGTDTLLRFSDPGVLAAGVPGAGAVSRAADVAMFYQALLHDPDGLWSAALLADGTGRIRNTHIDPMLGVPANRTLGLVVAGDDGKAIMRNFGNRTGPRAFGSPGVGGQVAWADPDTGLSVCYLTDGIERDVVASFKRAARISNLATETVSAVS